MKFIPWIRQLISDPSSHSSGHGKHAKARAGRGLQHKWRCRPRLELLEDRTLPSVTLPTVPTWIAEGPAPNSGGNAQGTNMASETGVANSPEDTGAVEAIAVNPGNSKNVFV